MYLKADGLRSLGTMVVASVVDHETLGLLVQIGIPLQFISSINILLQYYDDVHAGDGIQIPVFKRALMWNVAIPGELGDRSSPWFAKLDAPPSCEFALRRIITRKKKVVPTTPAPEPSGPSVAAASSAAAPVPSVPPPPLPPPAPEEGDAEIDDGMSDGCFDDDVLDAAFELLMHADADPEVFIEESKNDLAEDGEADPSPLEEDLITGAWCVSAGAVHRWLRHKHLLSVCRPHEA